MERATTAWILGAAAASVLPLLVFGGLRGEARFPAVLPSLLAALLCVQAHLSMFRAAGWGFWRGIRLSLLAWGLFELGAFYSSERDLAARGAGAVCLAALFVGLVLALDSRPHQAAAPDVPKTQALERVGAVVFAFGLLLYVAPFGGFELGLRCLLLLFILYLMARFGQRARGCPRGGWRSAYLALALGSLSVALSVAAPLAFGEPAAALLALLRVGGPLAIVVAVLQASRGARVSLDDAEAAAAAPQRSELLAQLWSGPLTAYAAAFPALHLAGYAMDALDPSLRNAREVVALVLLFALGGLALWQQGELQRQAEEVKLRFERVSQYDPLTGLASRTSFLERVSRSLERTKRVHGYQFAVLAVELERFKLIENAYGPRFARDIIVGLAARLKKCLRPGDMVASLGPDRFAVLADHIRPAHAVRDLGEIAQRIGGNVLGPGFSAHPETADGSQAAEIAERILRDAVSPPIAVAAREVYPRGSIGIATSDATYAEADEMLRDAQAAARRAKLRGGDTFEIFDPDMQAESLARVIVESELHHAVERGELLLQYQPVVRLDGAEIAGFEALLRWRHPTRGVLRPAEFLAAADTTGLMVPMTRFVLREACRRAAEWQRLAGRPLFVSCNVGGPQFQPGRRLREAVGEALRESGLSGSQLKLEITEGVAIASFEAVREEILALKGLGIDFLLDDFGTGYSSLSYLHRLPVKGIKIDRSFVESLPQDLAATALVRGIVELARELERDVIAEGVETLEQWDSVRALGCAYGQGFCFGVPSEPGDLAALLGAPRNEGGSGVVS